MAGGSIIDCYPRRRCVCGQGENDILLFLLVFFLVLLGMSHRSSPSVSSVSLLGYLGTYFSFPK